MKTPIPKTQVGALNCGAYGTPVRRPFLCYYPVAFVPPRRKNFRSGNALIGGKKRIDYEASEGGNHLKRSQGGAG